jgi:dihydrofolate reductase
MITIHMVASLDGFIVRKDGRVDWLETKDEFEGGATLTAEYIAEFLKSIDCYVIGARTYETALAFEVQGYGWAYGDTPTFVLTHHPRESMPMEGGTTFHVATGGIEDTLERAFAAAEGKDVRLMGGAATVRQYLSAG